MYNSYHCHHNYVNCTSVTIGADSTGAVGKMPSNRGTTGHKSVLLRTGLTRINSGNVGQVKGKPNLSTLHYITYLVSTYRIGLEQRTLQCHTMDAGEFRFTR